DAAGYSAPIAITVRGVRQVIVFTADAILSISPKDGRLFWRSGWKTDYDVNAATPIFLPPDKLFVSSGYGTGSALLQINRTNVVEVWRSKDMKNQFSSSVLHNGVIYGFDNATLKAMDAATGAERWKQRGFGHGSLILAGGHLVVLSDRGKLALVQATPEAYRELGTAQVLEGKCWTAPSLADGRLYVRNEEQLIALDWKGAAAPVRSGK
ncbi:MAG: PQQ-binding-like beta-propeller repeat protein, partial [Thermoanaerobaculia bacterium]